MAIIGLHRPFDVDEHIERCVAFIREYFAENASDNAPAVIGISGGKDSAVVAALCARALGANRVIGVMMPYGNQADIDDSRAVIDCLGIKSEYVDIFRGTYELCCSINDGENYAGNNFGGVKEASYASMKARMRMVVLYGISQSVNGRVANTCNYSEDYVGYFTRYGDGAGDFAPLADYLAGEVIAMAKALELPEVIWNKEPSDGLCGKTDEDNLGFTYDELDTYITSGLDKTCGNAAADNKIRKMHELSRFKFKPTPKCHYADTIPLQI